MICFHHNDNDGVCSGQIVKRKFPGIRCISITYAQTFPYDEIVEGELVVIVDYSFKKMSEIEPILAKTKDIIWIDHHKSSLAITEEIRGIRVDTYPAACFLCWKYFFPEEPMPEAVDLISDYDTWAFKFGDSTRMFNLGLASYCETDEDGLWPKLLDDTEDGAVNWLIDKGQIIKSYKDAYYRAVIKNTSFRTVFEGHDTIVANAHGANSDLFQTCKGPKDLMAVWFFNGEKFTISVYSATVDCESIAKKYGGGGHRGAAGWTSVTFPFKKAQQQG